MEENTLIKTIKIKEGHLDKVQKKILNFNKKMSKSGLPEVSLFVDTKHPIGEIRADGLVDFWLNITITGTPPILRGWKFVATVEHKKKGNVLRKIDKEVKIPEKYRDTSSYLCEHCGVNRQRIDTYLVYNETELKWLQVGSTCLKKGLGIEGTSPSQIATYLDFLNNFEIIISKTLARTKPVRMREHNHYGVHIYLAYVFYSAKVDGWVSKNQAYQKNILSTSERAISYMEQGLKISKVYYEWSNKAITYARTQMEVTAEYYSNLKSIIHENYVEERDLGYVASLAITYREYLVKVKETNWYRLKYSDSSKHFGTEGQRGFYNLTLVRMKEFTQNDKKCIAYHFADQEGNKATWFSTAPCFLAVGTTYRMRATIDRHEDFNGQKYTIIKRCEIVKK